MILRVNSAAEIVVHPKFAHTKSKLDQVNHARFYPVHSPLMERQRTWAHNADPVSFSRRENGDLIIQVNTFEEDEYTLNLEVKTDDGKVQPITAFGFYALEPDLFELRPFRGDFHMHSTRSDGRQSPEYVAAACRKIGDDFMALTDHGKYEPSLEAIRAMKKYDSDMLCIPGEEVHLPKNPVHVINFGANRSVNALAIKEDPEGFAKDVSAAAAEFPADMEPLCAEQTAISEWAFDKIREAGGIAMFCHPYWRPGHNYIGANVIELLMERRKFDVLEVFGGYYRYQTESNMLALSRYNEERSKGKVIPVAGVSDSHDCDGDLFGWYYTIVFAKELTFANLAASLRADLSVAVHDIPGEHPIAAGSFRLTKYAYFLLREYFPLHNDLCRPEGEAILRAEAGEESYEDVMAYLASRKGKVPALWKELWA